MRRRQLLEEAAERRIGEGEAVVRLVEPRRRSAPASAWRGRPRRGRRSRDRPRRPGAPARRSAGSSPAAGCRGNRRPEPAQRRRCAARRRRTTRIWRSWSWSKRSCSNHSSIRSKSRWRAHDRVARGEIGRDLAGVEAEAAREKGHAPPAARFKIGRRRSGPRAARRATAGCDRPCPAAARRSAALSPLVMMRSGIGAFHSDA